jgi:hypothetical protein
MPIKLIKLLKLGSFKVLGTAERIKCACIKAVKADTIEGTLAACCYHSIQNLVHVVCGRI